MTKPILSALAVTLLVLTTACEDPETTDDTASQDTGTPERAASFDPGQPYVLDDEPMWGPDARRITPVSADTAGAVYIIDAGECLAMFSVGCDVTYAIDPVQDCVHTMEVGGEDACANLYQVYPVDFAPGDWAMIPVQP